VALRFAAFGGANAPAIRARGARSLQHMDNNAFFQIESLRSKALRAHARKGMIRSRPARRARAWEALWRLWSGLRRLAR
jgi:hypothetical protein